MATVDVEASWDLSDPLGETQWLESIDMLTALPRGMSPMFRLRKETAPRSRWSLRTSLSTSRARCSMATPRASSG